MAASKITSESKKCSPNLKATVRKLNKTVINNILVENWKNSIPHIVKDEDSDKPIQCYIQPIVINLNDNSDYEVKLDKMYIF